MTELLTKETAVPNFTGPTGRRFEIRQHPIHPNIYEIKYAAGISGEVPAALSNTTFTKVALAETHLVRFLEKWWDEVNELAASKKIRERNAERAA